MPPTDSATPHRLTRRQALAWGAAATLGAPGLSWAQGDRPLRVILPLSAGSGADGAIRAIQTSLSKALGQPVVIENLPGAGGITGTTQLVRAPKDGSVIGVVSNNHVVNPHVYKSAPFDAIEDITPLTVIGATPFVLVAHPSVQARNVKELIALAKARPGVLNYGSSGNGTILHLGAAMFVDQAQVDIKHIPYRGMGPLMNDILGGQVQLGVVAVAPAAAHIKSGTLRALGVTTAARVPSLPDVPTIAEAGEKGFDMGSWQAVFAPAGTPGPIVDRLHAEIMKIVATPEVQARLKNFGMLPSQMTPAELGEFQKAEVVKWGKVIKAAGIKAE